MSTAPKGTTGKLTAWKTLYTNLILRDGFNVRFDYGDIEQLARSLADNGIERPLNVLRSPDDENKFYVIDGHRRTKAMEYALSKGWIAADTFPVPIMIAERGTTDLEQVAMIARANDGKPLTPIEEATLYKRLVDAGTSIADICRQVGHSDMYVRQHLDLLKADPAVTEALRTGEITKTLALNISTQAKRGRVNAAELVALAKGGTKESKREAAAAADPWIAKQRALRVRVTTISDTLTAVQDELKAALKDAGITRAQLRALEHFNLIKLMGQEAALKELVSGAQPKQPSGDAE